ncbi:MAG: PAS domain S-box protein, partial [Pyrinomonadaceae bacterium]
MEQVFDDLAMLAARICQCQTPMAFIAFHDGERFWFKSSIGFRFAETPQCVEFCSQTIDQSDVLVVNDASFDERFSMNPLVIAAPHIRFYTGVPLLTSDRQSIGTLGIADRVPRELSPEQQDALRVLSRQLISQIELRKHFASLSSKPGKSPTVTRETPARNIIRNKKIREELHESEAHHRIVAEMASDAIVTIDENSTILFANRATEKIFGYTAAELNGACLTMLMPERLRQFHKAGIRRFIDTGEKKFKWQLVEVMGRHKNGEEFPAEISFGEHLEDGKYYFTSVIRNVTERHRSANALRESEERFRQLAENVHEVFWLSKLQTHELIYVSPGYEEIWGQSLDSLYAAPRSWLDAVHPNDKERIRNAELLKQARGDYDEEYRVVQPDGSIRWIRDRAFPIKNNDGEVYRIAGVAADITARKLLEGRLTVQYVVTRVLSEAATLTEAAPQILKAVCENLDWKLGALWIVDNDSDEIYCVEIWHDPSMVASEFTAVTPHLRNKCDVGLPGMVWNTGSPKWIPDIVVAARQYDLPRAGIADKEGLRCAFGFPIRLGREILGVMEFYSPDIRHPDEDIIAMMSTIGSQIGQIAVRRRAEQALQQANVELESKVSRRTAELASANRILQDEIVMRREAEESRVQLLYRLVGAQEEERGRIARELHDKMGQYLTELILGLHSLTEICKPDPPSHKNLLRLLQVTDELMREVHHLTWELRPAILDNMELQAALENYLTQWSERTGIVVDFHRCNLDKQSLTLDIETTIYRIFQEALTNILKHAQAKHVSVVIECQQNHIQIMVEDDGKGFDMECFSKNATMRGRLGVVGMQERAAIVKGTLDIESAP